MSPERARALFTAARVARLATVAPALGGSRAGATGVPRLVPVTFAVAGGTVVTAVDHKPKTTMDLGRLSDITANPRVCLLVDHYEDDWERLWWARADGQARVVSEGGVRDRAVGLLVEKYAEYRDRPPEGPAVVVDVSRWSGWAYSEELS